MLSRESIVNLRASDLISLDTTCHMLHMREQMTELYQQISDQNAEIIALKLLLKEDA